VIVDAKGLYLDVFFFNKVSCALLASDWRKKTEEATGTKRAENPQE
jgi:hypothetical protein